MRICIYGAGATGGHFAVRLARAGHEVSVVARGAHLDVIRTTGLKLRWNDGGMEAPVRASDRPSDLGVQDAVLVSVKSTALRAVADSIAPLVGPDTIVAFPQNGMAWWYPLGQDPRSVPDLPIFRLSKQFLSTISPERVLGGIVYSANEVIEPGTVWNNSPSRNRLDLGGVTTEAEAAAAALRPILEEAGIASPPVADVRRAMWAKLVMNMTGSIIALVTGNRSIIGRTDPAVGATYLRAMREALAIAEAAGYRLDEIVSEKTQAALLDHKPSILQDYEQGRAMEIGEILLAPLAFARKSELATPTLDTLASIAARLAADKGLFDPSEWSPYREAATA